MRRSLIAPFVISAVVVGACSSEPESGPMYDYGIEIAATNPELCSGISNVIGAHGLDQAIDQIETGFSDAYRTSIPDAANLSLAAAHFSSGVLDGCELPEEVASNAQPSLPPSNGPTYDGSEFEYDDWRSDYYEDQRWSDYLRDSDR